jgi:hypothetical protein
MERKKDRRKTEGARKGQTGRCRRYIVGKKEREERQKEKERERNGDTGKKRRKERDKRDRGEKDVKSDTWMQSSK